MDRKFPSIPSDIILAVAIVWSTYQSLAGYQYGLYIFDSHREKDRHMVRVRSLLYGVHHGALYFLCSLSGFIAWSIVRSVAEKIGNWSEVAGGTGAILIALALISVVGVSGILPRILYLGNRPV